MADSNDKVGENVKGSYFVDSECVSCEACVDTAPGNFKMNEDDSHAYVYKQPESEEEKNACEDALAECPVDAIGNNG